MSKEQEPELQSIIELSDETIDHLLSMTNIIQENLQFLRNSPAILKPFMRKDLYSITSLSVEEWLGFLKKLKKSFESIKATAYNLKYNYKLEDDNLIEGLKQLRKMEPIEEHEKGKSALEILEKVVPLALEDETLLEIEKGDKPEREFIFCPECGYKCTSKNSLRSHIFNVHKDLKEELLKSVQLYHS